MGVFDELAEQLKFPLKTDTRSGLRHAQIAAVHSAVAHFWASRNPGLIVMPTGSGKTAVMIAASIALRAKRVLVVAPSRLLREQLVEKFSNLDPLRGSAGIYDTETRTPKVVEVEHMLTTPKSWSDLSDADVVIGTPMTMSPKITGVSAPPEDLFDLVLFDEAHHVPAPTYSAIAAAFPKARQLLFTATPFRGDDREVPGELIFTYELARAREDNVFGKLRFRPVEITAGEGGDEAIARAAIQQLKSDRAKGLQHRLVVRTSGLKRADDLHKVYRKLGSKLKLARIHSQLGAKSVAKTINDLRAGRIDGVIAVDMLGEGFDLPNLKVAALHTPHKSLAVTLQFIGRFARTTDDNDLGEATFFAIPDEVEGEAEGLFTPGAEWNEIVEELSQQRLKAEEDIRKVVAGFEAGEDVNDELSEERIQALIASLRPAFHAKVYDALGSVNLENNLVLPRAVRHLFTRRNLDRGILVSLVEEHARIPWSSDRALRTHKYDLIVVVHVPKERFVFVCTTRRDNSVYDSIIGSLAKRPYRRLAPNEINRVLRGLEGTEVFNYGARNRAGGGGAGAEVYRISAGRAPDKNLGPADMTLYEQGHAFCRGTQGGKSTVIGFSSGSKVWSSESGRITDLLNWTHGLAKKLRDSRPIKPSSNFERLTAAARIDALPCGVIAAELPVHVFERPNARVQVGKHSVLFVDLKVEVGDQTSKSVDFQLSTGKVKLAFTLDVHRQRKITARNDSAKAALVTDASERHSDPLLDFLNEHPPILYLADLSTLEGEMLSAPPGGEPTLIKEQIEGINWDALNVSAFKEKPPASAGKKSLFEYTIERLEAAGAAVIFQDDGSMEMADFIGVTIQGGQSHVQLVHCKAASRPSRHSKASGVPNERVDDLYEVLGQAVKCRRWLDARRMSSQIERRLKTAKQTCFVKGDLAQLQSLFRDPTKVTFQIVVVQPALSTDPKDTVADLVASADAYYRGGAHRPLVFVGTAPS